MDMMTRRYIETTWTAYDSNGWSYVFSLAVEESTIGQGDFVVTCIMRSGILHNGPKVVARFGNEPAARSYMADIRAGLARPIVPIL